MSWKVKKNGRELSLAELDRRGYQFVGRDATMGKIYKSPTRDVYFGLSIEHMPACEVEPALPHGAKKKMKEKVPHQRQFGPNDS